MPPNLGCVLLLPAVLLLWLGPDLRAGAVVPKTLICPKISDAVAVGKPQPIISECGAGVFGHCDAALACVLPATRNTTCATTIPCSVEKEVCLCTNKFSCVRRLGDEKLVFLLCKDPESDPEAPNHAKRQEAYDPTDADDDDDDAVPRDDTATFLTLMVISYLVLICVAMIYVRPNY